MSGEALPAHEAGQRGTSVSGKVLPAHETGQRGIPVSGKVLPAHEAISEVGGLVALLSKHRCDEWQKIVLDNIFLWKFVLLEINSVLWESFRWKLLYKCLLIL